MCLFLGNGGSIYFNFLKVNLYLDRGYEESEGESRPTFFLTLSYFTNFALKHVSIFEKMEGVYF